MNNRQNVDYGLLSSGEFTVNEISVAHRHVTPPNTYLRYSNEHKHDRMVYVVSGRCRFDMFNDKPTIASAGNIVYIPHNIAYRTEWLDDIRGEVYSINYIMNDTAGHQITICPEIHMFHECDNHMTDGFFKECCYTFENEGFGFALKCKITFLRLLHTIATAENEKKNSKIAKAIKFIEANYLDDFSITELAKMCNLGECMFRRVFKSETGISPLKYRNRLRIMRAYELLVSEACSVTKAMELTGFYDASYFNKTFKAYTGKSPSEIKGKKR